MKNKTTPSAAQLGHQLLEEILTESRPQTALTKRARCEENWAELVVAVVLADFSVVTKDDVIAHKIASSHPSYLDDLKKRPGSVIYQYIENFKQELSGLNLQVKEVFILGKTKNSTPRLKTFRKV